MRWFHVWDWWCNSVEISGYIGVLDLGSEGVVVSEWVKGRLETTVVVWWRYGRGLDLVVVFEIRALMEISGFGSVEGGWILKSRSRWFGRRCGHERSLRKMVMLDFGRLKGWRRGVWGRWERRLAFMVWGLEMVEGLIGDSDRQWWCAGVVVQMWEKIVENGDKSLELLWWFNRGRRWLGENWTLVEERRLPNFLNG